MVVIVVLGVGLLGLSVAGALGWVADSRDPDFGLGRVISTSMRKDLPEDG